MDRSTKAKLASQDQDLISSLPDEVIAHILRQLPPKEAGATSLLSKRWRYLWTTCITHLDFDMSKFSLWFGTDSPVTERSIDKFAKLVDGVLQHYNNIGDCERFRIRNLLFDRDFCVKHKCRIGRWIKFALLKKVKELELELWDRHYADPAEYLFSSDMFKDADGVVRTGRQNSGHIPTAYQSYGSSWTVGLRYLKHLSLKFVSIEGKFIDYMLANCSVLEQLVLTSCSFSWSWLRVSGRSLKLKVLHIDSCHDFKHIEIYDVNLVSLTFMKSRCLLHVDKVPQLVELCIGGPRLDGLSNSISHVQILKLEFDFIEEMLVAKLPTLRNVMHLEITLAEIEDSSLLPLTRLIEACPNLQRFILKVLMCSTMTVERSEVQRVFGRPFQNLEFIEFCGYYGRSSHYELVLYLVKSAIALRKLVVNPNVRAWHGLNLDEEKRKSRECAKQQLKEMLPSRIELVIL